MILGVGGQKPARALAAVAAVMADPGLAEHLPAEALREALATVIPTPAAVGPPLGDVEGVRCRPHRHHRLASLQKRVDMLHLLVGEVAKPRGDHHQVSVPELLEAGDVVVGVGVDLAGGRVDRKHHGAIEAVVAGEDLRQLREGLLAAVLLVAADEHDLLPLPGPVATGDLEPRIGGLQRKREDGHNAASQQQPSHGEPPCSRHRAAKTGGRQVTTG